MSMPKFGANVETDDGNCYVPNMTHHHHIDITGETSVLIENSVADDTELLAAFTTAAATTYDDLGVIVAEPFGRTLALTSTDADGTGVLHGKDYLGQPMSQAITFSTGVAATTKAFKTVDKFVSSTNVGDVAINAGSGYGLPFCASELVRETIDGAASTEGSLTAAVTTTPSSSTGDVRGTYNPNTAGNGAKDIEIVYVTTNRLTGGLYGQVQA